MSEQPSPPLYKAAAPPTLSVNNFPNISFPDMRHDYRNVGESGFWNTAVASDGAWNAPSASGPMPGPDFPLNAAMVNSVAKSLSPSDALGRPTSYGSGLSAPDLSASYAFSTVSSATLYPSYPRDRDWQNYQIATAAPKAALNATISTPTHVELTNSEDLTNSSVPILEDGEISSGEQSSRSDDTYAPAPYSYHGSMHETQATRVGSSDRDIVLRNQRAGNFETEKDPTKKYTFERTSISPYSPSFKQARMILQELQAYDIELQDLVEEGFDLKLLEMVLAQVGVSTDSASSRPYLNISSRPVSDNATQNIPSGPRRDQGMISTLGQLKHTPLATNEHISSDHQNDTLGTPERARSSDRLQPTGKKEISIDGDGKSLSSNQLGKVGNRNEEPKAVDRKEYIARMLAAKSRKTAPISSVTPQPPASPPHTPRAEDSSTQSIVLSDVDQLSAAQPHQGIQIPVKAPGHDSGIEAKGKSQTELVRQKMEALKAQREAQVRSQPANDFSLEATTKQSQVGKDPPLDMSQNTGTLTKQSEKVPPSRSASYFSPVSLKSAFNLPGLFSASEDKTSHTPTQAQTDHEVSMPGEIEKNFAPETASPAVTISVTENNTASVQVPALSSAPRKRQRAVDFIDFPTAKLRKSFSQSEDNSVVIDVSDDEDAAVYNQLPQAERKHIDPLRHGDDHGPVGLGRIEHDPTEMTILPVTTAIRSSDSEQPSLTQLNVQTKGKIQEPKVLKSKIEQMNREIAELEQRIKAKQTGSRHQSPGQSEKPGQGEFPHSALQSEKASNFSKGISVELLDSALVSGPVEVSSRNNVTQVDTTNDKLSDTGSEREDSRNGQLDFQPPSRSTNDTGSQMIADETSTDAVPNANNDIESGPTVSVGEEEVFTIEEISMKRTLLGRSLVDIDTEINKIEVDLESRKFEIRCLEDNLILARDRRKKTSDEMALLAESEQLHEKDSQRSFRLQLQPIVPEEMYNNGPDPPEKTSDSIMHIPRKISPAFLEVAQAASRKIGLADNRSYFSAEEQESWQTPVSNTMDGDHGPDTGMAIVEESSDDGPDEDGMDISRSDVDENEAHDAATEIAADPSNAMDLNDEEDCYEPPGSMSTADEIPATTVNGTSSGAALREYPRSRSVTQDFQKTPAESEQVPNARISTLLGPIESFRSIHDNEDGLENDSDDYEPPEPLLTTKDHDLASKTAEFVASSDLDRVGIAPSAVVEISTEPRIAQTSQSFEDAASPYQDTRDDANATDRSFVPYESPLKYFKSYRFHPQFLSDVANGFRSLTYSNSIQDQTPICPYELGGICNDAFCTNQHFPKMGLSDDIILREMGVSEGTTPEERKTYIDGLRELILDLRKRKVKDIDSIASEISRYRAKFLSDISRIMPR